MKIKGKSPYMRDMSRTHRVDLDWLCERINVDSNICVKYVHTNQQIADMLMKASFTRDSSSELMILFGTVFAALFPRFLDCVAAADVVVSCGRRRGMCLRL